MSDDEVQWEQGTLAGMTPPTGRIRVELWLHADGAVHLEMSVRAPDGALLAAWSRGPIRAKDRERAVEEAQRKLLDTWLDWGGPFDGPATR